MDEKFHYRLFAKLLMFMTLVLGGAIGFVGGLEVGKQNALELIQEGRQVEKTSVNEDADSSTEATLSDAQVKCYEDALGDERYAKYAEGEALTTEEVFKVLPCEDLESETTEATEEAEPQQ